MLVFLVSPECFERRVLFFGGLFLLLFGAAFLLLFGAAATAAAIFRLLVAALFGGRLLAKEMEGALPLLLGMQRLFAVRIHLFQMQTRRRSGRLLCRVLWKRHSKGLTRMNRAVSRGDIEQ